jgi:hypothetical protein
VTETKYKEILDRQMENPEPVVFSSIVTKPSKRMCKINITSVFCAPLPKGYSAAFFSSSNSYFEG